MTDPWETEAYDSGFERGYADAERVATKPAVYALEPRDTWNTHAKRGYRAGVLKFWNENFAEGSDD